MKRKKAADCCNNYPWCNHIHGEIKEAPRSTRPSPKGEYPNIVSKGKPH